MKCRGLPAVAPWIQPAKRSTCAVSPKTDCASSWVSDGESPSRKTVSQSERSVVRPRALLGSIRERSVTTSMSCNVGARRARATSRPRLASSASSTLSIWMTSGLRRLTSANQPSSVAPDSSGGAGSGTEIGNGVSPGLGGGMDPPVSRRAWTSRPSSAIAVV